MAFSTNSDMLKAKLGEEDSTVEVFTEEDRSKIRQTLSQFSTRQVTKTKQVEKVKPKNLVPNINNQKYHVAFSWKDWPKELDEIPQLFLFRLNLWPYLHYKSPVSIEKLQYMCIASGVSSIALDNRPIGYYMSGVFENGGAIRNMYLTLIPTENKEIVSIDNCTFKTIVE